MNSRERTLTFLLLGVVIAGGVGALGYFLYWTPMAERERRIAALAKDIDKRERDIRQVQTDLPRLERWKQLSLPGDVELARREYERYLTNLLRESGFTPGTYTVTPPRSVDPKGSPAVPGKGPVYTRLTYKVQAPVALGRLVTFLERFYNTAVLHQVRGLTLKRTTTASRSNELDVELTIEALVMAGPETKARPVAYAAAGTAIWAARPANQIAARTLALAPRDYEAMAAHNVFLGPAPPQESVADRTEFTRLIHLTGITSGPEPPEASFYYRFNNRRLIVRVEPDQDRFPILEDSRGRTLVEGVVMRMEERDIYFRVQLATEANGGRSRRGGDAERWTRPDAKVLDMLVRDQGVKPEETERVYQIGRESWDRLDLEDLVEVRDREFAFRWDLVCGRVLRADERTVVILVDEKYCAYRSLAGSENRFRRRRGTAHEGYFAFHVGNSLDEAMDTPLPEEQVKELKAAALPKRGDEARP